MEQSVSLHTQQKQPPPQSQRLKYRLLIGYSLFLLLIGLFSETPMHLIEGTFRIFTAPSNLISDYFAIGNFGSAFLNSGLLTLTSVLFAYSKNIIVSGPFIAAFFTVSGFSFFGKNLYNSIPIMIGVLLYAKFTKKPSSQVFLVGLFGSAGSPIISYFTFGLDWPLPLGILVGYTLGIVVGFILPALSSHFLQFHQGFSLYNVGFTVGIVAMLIMSVYRLFGGETTNLTMISEEHHLSSLLLLTILFTGLLILGYLLNHRSWKGLSLIFRSSGTLITDFIAIAGIGATLINMAIMGFLLLSVVLVMQGTLSGPIIGGILTVVGFSAFGNHWRNSLPVIIGVLIAAYLSPTGSNSTFTILLSAIFSTSLAPVSGYYGVWVGLIAGFFHMTLVLNITYLHGGLNLYNNGFSCGFVAAFMVPILDILFQKKKEQTHVRKRKS